ncbi:thiamine-phosphate kinase [uncultured Helicobacter sp.]|uniref:thiamine-phosphate kinase n=1 Tax=uncultured Helicobacter sp. TaxID=175537 RepID=UPI001C3A2B89|nr:thiamine-phosphate kinase [Candidatus Helicobacter avicola]
MQSVEELFLKGLQKSGVCAKLDNDVHIFGLDTFRDSGQWIVALDGFCEDIHFKRAWFSVYEATQKAFLVNLSDIIAKNAVPKYALLSLVIPRDFTPIEIQEIIDATQDICQEFSMQIVGGDTMCGNRLEFHICILAQSKEAIPRIVSQRKLAVFCTQDRIHKIGGSYRRLTHLLRYTRDCAGQDRRKRYRFRDEYSVLKVRDRFAYPKLRVAFMQIFGKKIRASMDISDGLLEDMSRLLGRFGIAYSGYLRFTLRSGEKWRWQSGEEYEILFAIAPKDRVALHRVLRICRHKAIEIGVVKRGKARVHTKKWH